jgi:hypothetical protein
LAILVAYILAAIVATIIFVLDKVDDFNLNKKEEKFVQKHSDYIKFKEKYDELRKETYNYKSIIATYKNQIDYYLKEMIYYPKYSEYYQYLEAKIDVKREEINTYKEKCDLKEVIILEFVEDNRKVIESIKEDRKEIYDYYIKKYNLKWEEKY